MSKSISIRYQKSIHFKVFEIYIKKYQKSIPSLKKFDTSIIYKKSIHFKVSQTDLKKVSKIDTIIKKFLYSKKYKKSDHENLTFFQESKNI